jgi:hypothetical protein
MIKRVSMWDGSGDYTYIHVMHTRTLVHTIINIHIHIYIYIYIHINQNLNGMDDNIGIQKELVLLQNVAK